MSTWAFPPGMLDFDPGSDSGDEDGLEGDAEAFIDSLIQAVGL